MKPDPYEPPPELRAAYERASKTGDQKAMDELNVGAVEAADERLALMDDFGGHVLAAVRQKAKAAPPRQRSYTPFPSVASAADDEPIELGSKDPKTGKWVLSPAKTKPTAEAFIADHYTHRDGRTIHAYAGKLWDWRNNHYTEIEDDALKSKLQSFLHDDAVRYHRNPKGDTTSLVAFDSNARTINSALDAIRAYAYLPATITPPIWLVDENRPEPRELLPCKSSTLHIPTRKLLQATPLLFNVAALDFDYNAKAPSPARWLAFLHELWKDDAEQIQALREWFGYVLTADTRLQKMLLLVGPRRSGKGTLARILMRLVGVLNCCGPTTAALAGNFGLQPLIGKTLAIISDARFSGENIGVFIERALAISGEDTLTVDRKFQTSVTMKLATRIMMLTNELPRLTDASGALAGRFIILRLTESFYGREDPHLEQKLVAELPGILLWALDGWASLNQRGRFVQPASVADAVEELDSLGSPVKAFTSECCEIGPGKLIACAELFSAWQWWSKAQGREHAGTRQVFSRDLHAAVSGIRTANLRGDAGRERVFEGITLNQSTKEAILAAKMEESGRRGYVP